MSGAHRHPIGVFDSGIGGLTVLKAVIDRLPAEDVVYLGDTARVPYGTKSALTVERYSIQNAAFLVERGIKLLVVACNTASATAIEALRQRYSIPVVEVINPGARAAVRASSSGRIGVIGTRATIGSGAYEKAIGRLSPPAKVISRPCPLFVPLAEEGWTDNAVARLAAGMYLDPLVAEGIDTLLLGCTHYPLLKGIIADVVGGHVALIDSAQETAAAVENALLENKLLKKSSNAGQRTFYVTDLPAQFWEMGHRFLGERLEDVTLVDIIGGGAEKRKAKA